MTAAELRDLIEEQRCRDAQLGAILTILLDKVVSLDREINELRVLTVTSDGGKVSPQ